MPNYKDKNTIWESELYDRLSQITGYPKIEIRDVMKALYEFVEDELTNGVPVILGKLGTIERKIVDSNGGYDFKTGARKDKKKVARIRFTPTRPLKTAIKNSIS